MKKIRIVFSTFVIISMLLSLLAAPLSGSNVVNARSGSQKNGNEANLSDHTSAIFNGNGGGDSYEPDNTSTEAKTISSGSPQTHSIVPADDQDWVAFQLTGTSGITLETSGATDSDTLLYLYDDSLNLIVSDDNSGDGSYSKIDIACGVDALPAGTYYVKVEENGNDTEIPSYDLAFTESACPPAIPALSLPEDASSKPYDYDLDFQWNPSSDATEYLLEWWKGTGTHTQPCGWSSSTSCNIGTVDQGSYSWKVKARNSAGESDWSDTWTFVIQSEPAPSANFTASPLTGKMPLTVTMNIGSTAHITDCSWDYGDGETGTSCASSHNHVYANSGTYTVSLSVSGPGGSDSMTRTDYISVGDSYEPDNTSGQATTIAAGSPQVHSIVPADDEDYVKFQLTALSGITIETSGATDSNTRLYLYDSSLSEIEFNDDDGDGSYSYIDRVCNVDALPAGTYYVKVDESGNNNEIPSYNLAFSKQTCTLPPTAPTLSIPENASNQPYDYALNFQWNSSAGATEYLMEWWIGSDTPAQPCGWSSSTSCNIGSVDPGSYSWHVKARNTAGESGWSTTWTFDIQSEPGPSANFTASPLSGTMPLSVTMHIEDLAHITSCSWNYGDGQTSTTCTVDHSHIYANSGTYTVTLSVSGPGGTDSLTRTNYISVGDVYEPDNSSGAAKIITSGSPQTHSIMPANDQDWVRFQLTATSAVTIGTSGTTGANTQLYLYNSTSALIESNDDYGGSAYSYIDRVCNVDALPAGTYYVKVDEFNNDAEISAYTLTFTQQTCPSVPTLSIPENASTKPYNYDLNFQWNSSANATEYLMEWWKGTGTPTQPCGWSSSTSCDIGAVAQGSYSWHVKARNSGGESAWSTTWTFQIQYPPPSAEFDATPLSGTPPLTVTMRILDTANITTCAWNYGDGQTSTTCTATHDHVYAATGTYTVTLSVTGPGGTDSLSRTDYIAVGDVYEPDNNSTQATTIASGLPQTHSIVPANDQDWVKFELTATSGVTLETSGTTDSNTRLYLYDSSLQLIEFNDDDGTGSYSYIDRVCYVNALPAGTYYVKVDEFGNDAEIPFYQLAFSQETCATVPAVPVTYTPSGNITTTRPAYVWSHISNATTYRLAVYDVSAAKYVIETIVSSSFCSTTTNKCTYTPAFTLGQYKDYQWKVYATNAAGSSPYSAFRSFKSVLATPVTYTPSGNITTTRPAYVWSHVSGATTYKLAVYDVTAARYVIVANVSITYCSTTTTKCTYTPVFTLSQYKDYQWKVYATNAAGSSPYSAFRSFKSVLPTPITYTPSGNITTIKPAYIWSRVSGATSYRLAVYDVTAARYVIITTVSSSSCSTTTNKCSYIPSTALTLNKNYQWKILASNAIGISAYSAFRSFKPVPPAIPVTYTPSGTTSTTKPAYVWSRVSGATDYKLAVYDVSAAKYVIIANVSSTYCSTTTKKCTYTPSTVLTKNKAYKWKVLAKNTSGSSAYSTFRSFAVITYEFNSTFASNTTGWTPVFGTWSLVTSSPGTYKTIGVVYVQSSVVYNGTYSKLDYSASMKRIGCSYCENNLIIRGTTTPINGEKNWNKGYYFNYSNGGYFSVWEINGNTEINLKPWTTSTAIKPNTWNTLRVTASGSSLKFYINGTLVWSGVDSSFTSGKVGFGMYRNNSTGNSLDVDWAKLSTYITATANNLVASPAETGQEFPEWTDPYTSPH